MVRNAAPVILVFVLLSPVSHSICPGFFMPANGMVHRLLPQRSAQPTEGGLSTTHSMWDHGVIHPVVLTEVHHHD
jgi:hypothetical protein